MELGINQLRDLIQMIDMGWDYELDRAIFRDVHRRTDGPFVDDLGWSRHRSIIGLFGD